MKTDQQIIQLLGGSSAVAKRLGYTPQRVNNWFSRGIPAKVRLEHQKLFNNKQLISKS